MSDAVKAKLMLRRRSDGMVVTHPDLWDWYGDRDEPAFIWTDGNFACDCNRADFFAQAIGEPEDENAPCGHEAFQVRLDGPNGELLYSEFHPDVHLPKAPAASERLSLPSNPNTQGE